MQAHEGVVTLAGTVSNLRVKQAAEHDARHIVGVANVHNLLKVRPARLVPDDDLRQTILDALARDFYLGHCTVHVQVNAGQALLSGHVSAPSELERAGEVAAGVSGVVDVNNRLEVLSAPAADEGFVPSFLGEDTLSPKTADVALAERIRTRYCWSASLHDQEVEVHVKQGRATLTGTVDTWLERKHAAVAAHEAGAREVNNHLLVLNTSPTSTNRSLAAADGNGSLV